MGSDREPIGVQLDIPHGPHDVPRIECTNCGTEHHIDAASGEYQGQCSGCSAFLRRPTPVEQEKFGHFMAWNGDHLEREWDQEGAA